MLNVGLFLYWFIYKRCTEKSKLINICPFFFLPSSFSVPLAGILEQGSPEWGNVLMLKVGFLDLSHFLSCYF